MEAANSKIIEYFIIEANEHLETLEKGILDLANMANDSEGVNEMFRAAHSIKGGAAMLGYTSIQKTAHRLEDAFKILRENYVEVDQKLESLFLKGYDILQALVEKLQSPHGLQEEEANALVSQGEPLFEELQTYLTQLLTKESESVPSPVNVSPQIKQLLRQMLHLFKQEATTDSRQKLQTLCTELNQVARDHSTWQELVNLAQKAMANPKHSYRILAPVIIKELKRGCDLIELGQSKTITPSRELEQLANAKLPQILVSLDPHSAAKTLIKVFNQQQLSQLLQILQTAR
ncbi:putative CheA signal transduction histidine kinase [Gloeothece citriformis PCC 7424]|uniref:Putative CheA signal transduction histidine kinase n=1 Tax=Gloeothece citriformis (strain PCC 7424) TaxID=65393 RepID=B7KEZ1_GLOC7|nr:Hpt domain-containing protein [Gloeothece citriformis]ACK70447.1 putative CheA signal transduction histidine kinase [Gloeothece citriformis PCC 7424]